MALTELRPGERAYARVRLEAPAVLTRGDRFILRQYSPSITIGGGRVIDPVPARSPIRTAAAVARFVRLADGVEEAAQVFVEERRGSGLELGALGRRAGVSQAETIALTSRLEAAGAVVNVKGTLFATRVVDGLADQLVRAVTEHHRVHPISEGLPREEARERVFGRASAALFDAVVAKLSEAGKLAGRDRLALPGRGVSLTAEEAKAQEALDRVFREAGLAPPDMTAAAASAGVSAAVADRISKLLLRQKTLVKVETLLFHSQALDRLKEDVRALKQGSGQARLDVAGFKQRYGISRKYAIPLLEWLDRERVTRRSGDARVVL